MDKHLVACSLASGNIKMDIPTLGGAVFAMALSPLDPNRLAIGSSDSKVFVWNMSSLASLDIVTYWKKIIGKVMALCWHPKEENWLAYGTSDGHVGIIDVGSNKIPTLFRLHHRKAVYRICWSLPVLKPDSGVSDKTKLVLYSVGDGDVFQYTANPQEPDEEPKSLNSAVLNSFDKSFNLKNSMVRSDIAFKPDFTCFAIGNEDGSMYVVSCETLKLLHTVYPHKKLMNNLDWHPETVASDNNISPYKDWLATSCDNIKVYNIPAEGQPELVATLSGHSEKIVGLAWSPHFNGRLLSASYDDTVQVWDVPSQSCLGLYRGHSMAVMCALFSPQHPDMVISGSTDNTVQHWSMKQLTKVSVAKPCKKRERLGALEKVRSCAEPATELVVGDRSSADSRQNNAANTSSNSQQSISDKSMEEFKKRLKARAVFTVTSPKLTQARHFDVLYQRWMSTQNPPTPLPMPSPADEESPAATDLGYLDFFGDDKAMRRLLMVEESRLVETKQHTLTQISTLWRGDVSQMLQEAIAKKQLSDWVVSMAPLAGFEMWEAACAAYAEQLTECGDVLKASTYLLAIHKAHEAVQLLADHKLYKEAVAVARCRLVADDPLTADVFTEWGNVVRLQGNFTLAAHCYLAANNSQACMESLARVKELKYLKMAAMMAKHLGQCEKADSLAAECLTMCVASSNFTVGHQLVTEMPQYQYWSVWLRSSELLAKVKNRGEGEVFDWLEGRLKTQISLTDELSKVCSLLTVGNVYEELLPHLPTNKNPEFERDLWYYVSGQLAGACAARLGATPAHFLRHTVSAFSAAFHYQLHHPSSLALPLIVSVITPTGLFAEKSMFATEYKTDEERQLGKSLRAFVCASIVHWMSNNWEKVTGLQAKREDGSGDSGQKTELYKMGWLPELIANCSLDVLDAENVSFFVKKALKEGLQNLVTNENIQKRITTKKNVNGSNNQNKKKEANKTNKASEPVGNGKMSCVESQTSGKEVAKKVDETLNIPQSESKISVKIDLEQGNQNATQNEDKLNAQTKAQEQLSPIEQKSNITVTNTKENPDDDPNVLQITTEKNNKESSELSSVPSAVHNGDTASANSLSTNGDTCALKSLSTNGNVATTNGTSRHLESEDDINVKLKEIKELDQDLQKFEAARVSVPSPFIAYMNIKYLIDNLVSKQDSKLAQSLLENCDSIWKKSHK
uniref:Uncharacterized protein n=2 Tax=Graphocephala atropunctata TaxID=36148 RepID=A0A1B6L1G8_9HEMI